MSGPGRYKDGDHGAERCLRIADRLALRPAEVVSGSKVGQTQPELLTLPAAARRAGVGVRQLRRAAKRGELPIYSVGTWPRVRWRDVLRWIGGQRVPATPHAEQRVAEVLARESRRD